MSIYIRKVQLYVSFLPFYYLLLVVSYPGGLKGEGGGQGGPQNFLNNQSKCVSKKRTIKICIICCWWCPGTYGPIAGVLVPLHFRKQRMGRVEVRDSVEGVTRRNGRE